MFIVCHRHHLRLFVAVAILLVTAIPLLSVWQQAALAQPLCIGIDPGHGGYDGGVKGLRTGMRECDVNLSVATYLAAYLQGAGYRVVLTRTQDKSPVEEGLSAAKDLTAGSKKVRDMQLRLQRVHGADCALLVSVHCNFYPSSYRRGIQVFYSKQADLPLAQALQDRLNDALNTEQVGRAFEPLWGDYYLPLHADCPTAIVECGFLSNPQDEELLSAETYRMGVAYHLFCAIETYLQTKTTPNKTEAA